jgi:hypothetical protein
VDTLAILHGKARNFYPTPVRILLLLTKAFRLNIILFSGLREPQNQPTSAI